MKAVPSEELESYRVQEGLAYTRINAIYSEKEEVVNALTKLHFFEIFKRISEKVQADGYPTLNYCVPYYLRLMDKIKKMKKTTTISHLQQANGQAIQQLQQYAILGLILDNDIQAEEMDARLNNRGEDIPREVDSEDEMFKHRKPILQEVEWRR
ncbi:hypothetical protein V492_04730 [Pseudogymnoascus sp. VKM F-4246]|nr:hypothetical protein V492_04730 [Pseudogymnoascus sp. VKM F-4246]